MSADDSDDPGDEGHEDVEEQGESRTTRERLEAEADRAVAEFDESLVDLLAWILDTETRARIYVYLRQYSNSTSEEVADGTGFYPSTVREALAELHEEGRVSRRKRESAGAGNNPYEYEAMAPNELIQDVVGQVQSQLNAVFNLDRRLGGADESDDETPVTITVGESEGEE